MHIGLRVKGHLTICLYVVQGWFAVLGSSTGGAIAIFLFGVVGLEMKQKAPTATTIMQVVRKRWGMAAHLVSHVLPPQPHAAAASSPSLLVVCLGAQMCLIQRPLHRQSCIQANSWLPEDKRARKPALF